MNMTGDELRLGDNGLFELGVFDQTTLLFSKYFAQPFHPRMSMIIFSKLFIVCIITRCFPSFLAFVFSFCSSQFAYHGCTLFLSSY